MAYVTDVLNKDVRTEGMSYGMMIAVQLDRKKEFDRLRGPKGKVTIIDAPEPIGRSGDEDSRHPFSPH